MRRLGSNPQQFQHRFQKGCALAVLGGWIEQVGDDPREAEFVVAEVAEDVEAARKMAIQVALYHAGGVQVLRQLLKETDALALAAANAIHIVQEANTILISGLPNLVQMVQESEY